MIFLFSLHLIRVYAPPEDVLPYLRSPDVALVRKDFVDLVVDEDGENLIKALGLPYRIRKVRPLKEVLAPNVYHTEDSVRKELHFLASTYPSIVLLDSAGPTYEGRYIYILKISDNPEQDENEKGILINGCHHAREWMTVEICLYLARYLCENYGTDPDITYLVNEREFWIIPLLNPDGFVYDNGGDYPNGRYWRKNRRYFPEFDTYGVDLNRNYNGACNGDPKGAWGALPGWATSHYPSHNIYCGPSSFSEAETQVIKELIISQPEIQGVISYHTYSECVMWPWGYTNEPTPDDSLLSLVGKRIASRIKKLDGSGPYEAFQSVGLYPTSGVSDDWIYGYSLYVRGKGMFVYTIEADTTFYEDPGLIDTVCNENLNGILYLAFALDTFSLSPLILPPEIDTSWVRKDTIFLSIRWRNERGDSIKVMELVGLSEMIDGAEDDIHWFFEGFYLSTNAHSGIFSYASSGSTFHTCWIELEDLMPIYQGEELYYYISYDIEENYDMAFLEVSEDGRRWMLIDKYTGNNGGWQAVFYDLSPYSGSWIKIRWRYDCDGWYKGNGIFIDQINSIKYFNSRTIYPPTTDTIISIPNKTMGIYWYRVSGWNKEKGWGDWSVPIEVVVKGRDFYIDSIIFPDTLEKETIINPVLIVGNDGKDDSAWIYVSLPQYLESLYVYIDSGYTDTISFPEWSASQEGSFKIISWVEPDLNTKNDTLSKEFVVIIPEGVREKKYLVSFYPGWIHIDIQAPIQCNANIYDVSGRRIKSLIHGRVEPGRYSFRWRRPGIYFLRINKDVYRFIEIGSK